MRVLHINCNYLYTDLHQQMIRSLTATGVESTVFAPMSKLGNARITPDDNVIAVECFNKLDRFSFYHKQSRIYKALCGSISVKDFDIIHAYTLFTDGNVAYRLNRQYGIPYVVAVRNTDVNTFFKYRPYLKGRALKIFKNASAIFFLSEKYRDRVYRKYVPADMLAELENKTHIIPNGIDSVWLHSSRSKTAPEGKAVSLVYAGAIDKNKNALTTAKACERLISEGYTVDFTVVGSVHDQSVYQKLQKYSFVHCYPRKTKQELIELYKTKDIFVMPSFYETFGLVYAEAISQGLPVIYSRGQGFDGQFPEGHVGYSTDSSDAGGIADAVVRILEDYGNMSVRCMESCGKFSWSKIASEYELIYTKIKKGETIE